MCAEDENLFNFALMIYNKHKKIMIGMDLIFLQNYSSRVGALDLGFFNKKNIKKVSDIKNIYKRKIQDTLYCLVLMN